jgi:hypothetical protein
MPGFTGFMFLPLYGLFVASAWHASQDALVSRTITLTGEKSGILRADF